jgi:hypothetical protein
MLLKKKLVAAVLCVLVCLVSLPAENGDDKSVLAETLEQYERVVKAVGDYWEGEVRDGLQEGRYLQSGADYSRVRRVFDRLQISPYFKEKGKFDWRIYVQDSNAVNAFSAVNGILIINRGIVANCNTDDELAVVIGHEMGHMVKNHVKIQIAVKAALKTIIPRIAGAAAEAKNKNAPPGTDNDKKVSDKEMFEIVFGLAGHAGLLAFNRAQEKEADELGALYAGSAGYDANAGYEFWKRMAGDSKGSFLSFLSAHPESEDRAAFFTGWNERYGRQGKITQALSGGMVLRFSVVDFFSDFNTYAISAGALLVGREIVITGEIKDIDKKVLGKKTSRVELKAGRIGDFDCYFDDSAALDVLKKGNSVEIRGTVKDKDTLEHCRVIE